MILNRKFVAIAAATAALALSACATSTPYQPAGPSGYNGYSEQRLNSDRYRVSFSGNSLTSREQVEMSLLLRAAELTTQNGYDWFSTANRDVERDTRFYAQPDPFYYDRYRRYWGPSWRFYRRGYWSRWDPFWGPDIDIRQVDRYEATADIVLGRGQKPAGDPNAFDAREVIENIGGRVTRPQ
jgi:hypothetical protein